MTGTDTIQLETETVVESLDVIEDAVNAEIFEHAAQFETEDSKIVVRAVFRWLLQAARENDGQLTEEVLGEAGSNWLLRHYFGATLQSAVDRIVEAVAAEQAIQDMTNVFLFSNMMMMWRLNDEAHFDRIFSETARAEDLHGTN